MAQTFLNWKVRMTIYDLSVSRNLLSKAEMRQFCALGTEGLSFSRLDWKRKFFFWLIYNIYIWLIYNSFWESVINYWPSLVKIQTFRSTFFEFYKYPWPSPNVLEGRECGKSKFTARPSFDLSTSVSIRVNPLTRGMIQIICLYLSSRKDSGYHHFRAGTSGKYGISQTTQLIPVPPG